jgi:hypothetical protein
MRAATETVPKGKPITRILHTIGMTIKAPGHAANPRQGIAIDLPIRLAGDTREWSAARALQRHCVGSR